ncbi:MAG: ATP-binding protein [Muribaculaceae bacterium]|nr:ATP-binding protein [Muribaculaceae bacterium]
MDSSQQILSQLASLHFPGMRKCWQTLMETGQDRTLALADALQLLLQAEDDHRRGSRHARLIKEARFRYCATLAETRFEAARGFDRAAIMALATGQYLSRGEAVIVTGATGTGKSWLATALGYQACSDGKTVRYYNLAKLFEAIDDARIASSLSKLFDRLGQIDLLILDDFGVKPLDGQQLLDLMEIIDDRYGRKSTIIASQLPVASWYDVLKKNTTAADAILDRIVHTATRFELKGQSLRKKH